MVGLGSGSEALRCMIHAVPQTPLSSEEPHTW